MKKYLRLISALVVMFTFLLNNTINALATTATTQNASALQGSTTPKEEFRGAWVSTAYNIDWQSSSGTSTDSQKQHYINLLNDMKYMNFNAVMFQVRPMGDAFYPSNYAPWSKYITGTLGKDPGYDPLQFALEEAKKRNLEFHAWFNPFRISSDPNFNKDEYMSKLPASSPLKAHPEWIVKAGNYSCLNPGIPEARQYIIDTILEVVKNYDIDAVHLDDYFYPGTTFPDENEYATYGSGFTNIGDWRRDNINKFVSALNTQIKAEKSYVKFGISPSGIWRNKTTDPSGSNTNGKSHYDSSYADTVKWINESWIDYIIPQIYWYMGQSGSDYTILTDWWSNVVKGKRVQLYLGQAAYKIGTQDSWLNGDEILNQITLNRQHPEVKGSAFYSIRDLSQNKLGIKDNLKNTAFKSPALVPSMSWIDSTAPTAPNLTSVNNAATGIEVNWTNTTNTDASYYVIYRFLESETININNPDKIVGTVQDTKATNYKFLDSSADTGGKYYYVVTSVDRLHNESAASNARINYGIKITNFSTDKASPQKSFSSIIVSAAGESNSSELLYKFSISDGTTKKLLQDYSKNKSCEWLPSKGGNYNIILEVKKADSSNTYDVIMEKPFTINSYRKIFLDPGHGGKDSGAVGYSGSYEKTIALSIGNKINTLLAREGIETMMSRTADTFPTLGDRTTMANNWGCDLFVSLHCNSDGGTGKAYGIETFHYPGNAIANAIAAVVQKYLIKNTGAYNRGVKTADYYVLRETTMSSILIEFGFMTNANEEAKLKADYYQNICAESVKDAVMEYYGIVKNDLNKDGAADIKDIAYMAKRYNLQEASANWNEGLDFNNDKIIDIYDLINFSKVIK